MQMLGEKVFFSKGSEKNLKITTIEDIEIFESYLESSGKSGVEYLRLED